MGPEEIAKLITEDPNVMAENPKAIKLGPSDKARSRKRKRRLERMKDRHGKQREFEKDKEEYKVDKISGQPKAGQILYSDVPTDRPSDITEATKYTSSEITRALEGAGKFMQSLINSPWSRGEWESGAFKTNRNLMGSETGSIRRANSIKNALTRLGYTHSGEGGRVCRYLLDLERLKGEIADAKSAAGGSGPSPIAFPKGEWWGHFNWASAASRKEYLNIFMGEVLTYFLGMVELKRDEHAKTCNNAECMRLNHAEYVAREILCKGDVRLWTVYTSFNRERADIINASKTKKKQKKKKQGIDRSPVKGDPLHTRLSNFEQGLMDQVGKRFIASGMPRVPIYVAKGVDLRDWARKYLQIAQAHFGDEIDIDNLWRQSR